MRLFLDYVESESSAIEATHTRTRRQLANCVSVFMCLMRQVN